MNISGTDLIVISVALIGIIIFSNFYPIGNTKYVVMNRSFNASTIDSNKSICDDVNCSDIERFAKTVSSVTTTTTTTLKIYFFNTSGATSSLIKSGYGDILVDCGSKPDVMDKIYFTGSDRLKNIFLTKMDLEHGGGCGRTAMMLDHGEVFDAGANVSSDWSSDYYMGIGDSRRIMKSGGFKLGKIIINSSIIDTDRYLLKVSGNGFSVAYIGDCSKDYSGFSNSSIIVCDRDIDEAYIMRNRVYGIVVFDSDDSFESTYVKYGVKAYKMDFNKDYVMTITNNGFNIEVKKGI